MALRPSIGVRFRFLCLLCVSYAVAMTVSLPTLCVLLSHFAPEAEITCFPFTCFLAVYLSINLFGNWFLFRSHRGVEPSPRERSPRIEVCSVCDSPVDRETSHCPVCNICVYRRDHHCFFLGGCVGHHNLHSFVAFCIHACIGCLYATLLVSKYLRLEYRELWSVDFLYYVIPYAFVRWCEGAASGHHLLLVVVLNGVVATFVSTLGMVHVHLYLVLYDLTSYEMWRTVDKTARRARHASLRNFGLTFGHNWGLRFLWPFIGKHSLSVPVTAKCV